jgi:hypothetical protein
MFKDFIQKMRIYTARMRVERPSLPLVPKFKTTMLFLWFVAIFGLLYGRFFYKSDNAQMVSLVITSVSWVGSVVILLLEHPLQRLRLLLYQIFAVVLFLSLLVAISITYSLLFYSIGAATSIKLSWIIGSLLLGVVSFYSLYYSFARAASFVAEPYPGLRTAPLLFLVLATNYIAWSWQTILGLLI